MGFNEGDDEAVGLAVAFFGFFVGDIVIGAFVGEDVIGAFVGEEVVGAKEGNSVNFFISGSSSTNTFCQSK